MDLTEISPQAYNPMRVFTARDNDFRARTSPAGGGCTDCDGYGLHLDYLPTVVTCADCLGTGRTQ